MKLEIPKNPSTARQQLKYFPWEKVDPAPIVHFEISHTKKDILLKFEVFENEVLARYNKHNDPVYTDSAVEFFISFNDGASYYNFEFNCLGTCLAAHGTGRSDRESTPTEVIEKIKSQTHISRFESRINWTLSLIIPIDVFIHSDIKTLTGQKAKANFYKCGEDLAKPHYLVWNNILTDQPDYHQSKYFGELIFL